MEICATEKSVGPPTTRREQETETESKAETEIEFAPIAATSIVGPFKYTAEVTASYPSPAQREAVAEAPLGADDINPKPLLLLSISRTHAELFILFT